MATAQPGRHRLGWVGTGRMGQAMAARLAGRADLAVYNRTRSKAEALAELGATVVDRADELADRDIVFIMVGSSDDLLAVLNGPEGLLGMPGRAPRIIVDCSTVSAEASAAVRSHAAEAGAAFLAAPVSGNPSVVKSGKLSLAVSGPDGAYAEVLPYLELLGSRVTYVGDAEQARLVKICHNLFLGVVAQSLAEVTVLAQKGGVSRAAFLDFLNHSVLGSTFSRYKTPALVNLDFRPTFTSVLLRKDFDLGMAAGRELGVPMPVAALVHQLVQSLVGSGMGEVDFAALITLQGRNSGLELTPEGAEISDGLQ